MKRLAAIDVGTNTVRLLVGDVGSGSVATVDRALEITRLGQGVDDRRLLDAAAMERTLTVVADHARRAGEASAEGIRIAGTSALRDASNEHEFAAAVAERTGLELEILDGVDEGRLSFLGATSGLQGGPFLVCDIGGGSTEFVRGSAGAREGSGGAESIWSADIGSVRLRERYLTSDPATRGELAGALTAIGHELLQVERDVGLVGDEELIGVAGTVTALAALVLGLERYDPERIHGCRISRADVSRWSSRLLSMPSRRIRQLPTMHPGRADVIGAGVLILREVVERWGFDDVRVSERDILDGLLLDMVHGPDAGVAPVPELRTGGTG